MNVGTFPSAAASGPRAALRRLAFPLLGLWSQWRAAEVRAAAATVADLCGLGRADLCLLRVKTCFVFADAEGRIYRLPATPSMRASFREEYRIIDRVRPHLPVAVPAAELIGQDPVVARYRAIPGVPLPGMIAAFRRRGATGWLDDLAAFLVALHGMPVPDGCRPADFIGGRRHAPRLLRRPGGDPALADEMARMIERARAVCGPDVPRCLCHGDLKGGNVLVDRASARVTGVIDFGAAGLGIREWDIARMHLPEPERADLVRRYEARAGRPLDRDRFAVLVGYEKVSVRCRRVLARMPRSPRRPAA